MKTRKQPRPPVQSAASIARFLWPNFWAMHGCVFVTFTDQKPNFNPPPDGDTATGWESFVNHTHIFDEFRNKSTTRNVVETFDTLSVIEEAYDDVHPDFIAACELGRTAARIWSLKLKLEFPNERFRVYYTEYDNPIVRFHRVRISEDVWIADGFLRNTQHPDFRNALIYDTDHLANVVHGPKRILQ